LLRASSAAKRRALLEALLGAPADEVLADLAGDRHQQVAQVAVDRAAARA
jgi:hypothetical protein